MMKQVQYAGFNEKRVAEQPELGKNAFELVYMHARELAEMSAESRTEARELPFAGLRVFAERLALSVSLLCSAAGLSEYVPKTARSIPVSAPFSVSVALSS